MFWLVLKGSKPEPLEAPASWPSYRLSFLILEVKVTALQHPPVSKYTSIHKTYEKEISRQEKEKRG